MRWLTYFILAYVVLGLQVGLAPYVAYQGAAPNLVLLAVVFIAINAPRDAALLGCFSLGVLQDLMTQQPLGLFALSYGVLGMLIVNTQGVVYREHPLTHVSLALIGGVVTSTLLLVHGWVYPPGPRDGPLGPVRLSIATEFTRLLYTAVLALPVLWALQRMKRLFNFQPPRRKVRAW